MKKGILKKEKKEGFVSMMVVNPNAAGIDVGSTLHAVAVPKDRDQEFVRTFGALSCDLEEIACWLEKCGVDSVAMESTGVYWKPLFNYLTGRNFAVYLVNARHLRHVTGRKTDQSDAEWIQQLHTCGLLKGSYQPDHEQESLRALVRHRKTLVLENNRFVLRIQKALELMNIKLHTVISDLMGQSGTAVLEAIIAGERNTANFLPLIHKRIKADREIIVKSLEGTWQAEQLFILEENYTCYKFFKTRIEKCDQSIAVALEHYCASENSGEVFPERAQEVEESDGGKKKEQECS